MKLLLNNWGYYQSVVAIGFIAQFAQITVLAVLVIHIINSRRESIARGMDILGTESPVICQVFATDGISVFGE